MPSPNRDDGDALAVPTDVAEQQQVRVLVDKAVETYGRIDVMLNNAGLMPLAPFEKLKTDEWDRMIDVDFKGVRYGIAAALPHMKKQKSGHFINVCNQPNGLEAAHIQRQWDTHDLSAAPGNMSQGKLAGRPADIRTKVASPSATRRQRWSHRRLVLTLQAAIPRFP